MKFICSLIFYTRFFLSAGSLEGGLLKPIPAV